MKRFLIVFALVAIVALPFVLRPKRATPENADVTLVLVTPHNEAIRQEFGAAFKAWYKARTGKTVFMDWRVLGGTTEIARFLEGEYVSSFQNHWERRLGKPWSAEIQSGFQDGRLPANAPAIVREARAAFMASDVGCGIDLFFGGGTFDFARQALAGRIVDAGILQRHPEWFADSVIPRIFAGEEYWDAQGRWFGCVLSSYGIVFNRDSLRRLGIERPPQQWDDVTDARYFREVALCDPTKSGSIAKAFENIIQQQIQRRLTALNVGAPADSSGAIEAQAVREGWIEGLRLMQRVGANARYFTDTSQKPPIDVASGNCAVGLCIDFYGRQQEEAVRRRDDNSDRLGFVAPVGGTVSSVDPIALLRGARNREVAVAFIEFVLSLDGQKLWNFKPGTPGGPQHFALRRLPLRKDFYLNAEWRDLRSDPEATPFGERDQLIYRYEWTGGIFREMAFIIRVICQDTHPELKRAWAAIIAAPEPAKSRALAELHDLSSVNYDRASREIKTALSSKNKVDEVRLASDLAEEFRRRYERAEAIAEGR
jgi:ABC-type Fe3+ transport system substrate-binding protein